MPRSKAVFDWIFGLQGAGAGHGLLHATDPSGVVLRHDPRSQGFWLEYISVSDEGLDAEALKVIFAYALFSHKTFQMVRFGQKYASSEDNRISKCKELLKFVGITTVVSKLI